MVGFHTLFFTAVLPSVALGASQTVFNPLVPNPCASLAFLPLANTSILEASYVTAGSNKPGTETCRTPAVNTVDICRVYGVIFTSQSSAVKFEVWLPLPENWYGRILTTGNGGLGGCIDYANLDYGTSLHFATVGSDGGHDGFTALPFLHRPEIINDFSYRSIHASAVIGKQIVEAYYGKALSKSYYLGCSAGGRQGVQSALLYPEDFDGIVGGAPAVDWNHFIGSEGIITGYVGGPVPEISDRYIEPYLWNVITREILRQCDALDNLVDGIIAEPDECDFDPAPLLCTDGQVKDCLTEPQVDGIRSLYQPIYGTEGQLLWPRYDPGAELDKKFQMPMAARPSEMMDWMKYAVYNDSNHNFLNFTVSDIEYADTINPGGIATWSGDFSAFRDRGGKFLTYHGRSDSVIPSGNSKRFYELISSTLELPTLDDFYRLFLVPGMFHCEGSGAWAIGQGAVAGALSNVINDTAHNVLLALVDWVEGGIAPDHIIGSDDRLTERMHCRYPYKSTWDGSQWDCT